MLISIWLVCMIQHMPFAQGHNIKSGQIEGKVIDKADDHSIEYAMVIVYNTLDSSVVTGGITDVQGVFLIENLDTGCYYLKVKYLGYSELTSSGIILRNYDDKVETGVLYLEEATNELHEVVVKGKKQAVSVKIDKEILQLGDQLVSAGGTAVDALKVSSSITVNHEGKVQFRGSMGFRVLVNGKPTALKPQDALKQIPVSRIEKIELITNPSARFDSEGSAGIINIFTKSNSGQGIGIQLNSMIGSGDKSSADVQLNFSSEKIQIHGGISWKNYKQYYNMPEYIETVKEKQKQKLDIFFRREQIDNDFGANASVEYVLNPQSTLQCATDAGFTNFYVNAIFKYDESIDSARKHLYTLEDLRGKILAKYFTNTLSYIYKPNEKNEWTTDMFYSTINYSWSNDQDRTITGLDFDVFNLSPYFTMRMNNKNKSDEIRFGSSYSHKFDGGHRVECGLQYHNYHRTHNLIARNYLYDKNVWEDNPVFTNTLDFKEEVWSAFSGLEGQLIEFKYNLGMRLEATDRLIESFTLNQKYSYKKVDYFPVISISRAFGESLQLALHYSRRIDRPDEYYLNPFPDVSNDYQQAYGNPLLRPNITNAIEFRLLKNYQRAKYSAQIYMRSSKNAYDQFISPNSEGKITLTFDNAVNKQTAGIESLLNVELENWWNMSGGLNVFYENTVGTYSGYSIDQRIISYDARINQTFNLGKTTTAQLMVFYFHNQISALGEVQPFYWADISMRQSLLKEKLAITFIVKDIFHTNQLRYKILKEDYIFKIHKIPEYPVIMMSLNYTINKYTEKEKRAVTKLKLG